MDLHRLKRLGLGSFMVLAGIGHLTFARKAFRAQVPPEIPLPEDTTVVVSGIVEIGLGAALLLAPPPWRRRVGNLLAVFFVAIFPGNLAQWALHRDSLGLDTDRKRFLRLFMQPALVAAALYSTRD